MFKICVSTETYDEYFANCFDPDDDDAEQPNIEVLNIDNNNNNNNNNKTSEDLFHEQWNRNLMGFLDQCRFTGHFSLLSDDYQNTAFGVDDLDVKRNEDTSDHEVTVNGNNHKINMSRRNASGAAASSANENGKNLIDKAKLQQEFLYKFITSHRLTEQDIFDGFCARSTIVTHDNKDRHMVNLACSIQFAHEMGMHVVDIKAPLCGSVLECLSEADRRQAVRLLDPNRIVKFLKILCEFVEPGTGITRATEGHLYKIIFPITDDVAAEINSKRGTGDFHDAVNNLDIEQRSPEAVLILLPRSCFYHDLTNYIDIVQNRICPEINSDEWIVYSLVPQNLRWCDLMNSPSAKLDLFAVGYPFTPACGVTFHKVIGRTLEELCVDLSSSLIRFSFILVALSRTKDHRGLKFLLPDNPDEVDELIAAIVDYQNNERFRIDKYIKAWWQIVQDKISKDENLRINGFKIDPKEFADQVRRCRDEEDDWSAKAAEAAQIRKDDEKKKRDEATKANQAKQAKQKAQQEKNAQKLAQQKEAAAKKQSGARRQRELETTNVNQKRKNNN